MANSARYRELVKRLTRLRRRFLPLVFSPTGTYTERQYDLVRAYHLLAHAEIEHYLEETSMAAVAAAVRQWEQDRKATPTLVSLLALFGPAVDPDKAVGTYPGGDWMKDHVDRAIRSFSYRVHHNNGVREKDTLTLLFAAGLPATEVSTTWLATLDSFGQARGEVAHTAAARVRQLPDPKDVLGTVESVVQGIKPLDEKLRRR